MKKAQRFLVKVNLPEDYSAQVMGGGHWGSIRKHNGCVGEVRSLKGGSFVKFEDMAFCLNIPAKWLEKVPYPESDKKRKKKIDGTTNPV